MITLLKDLRKAARQTKYHEDVQRVVFVSEDRSIDVFRLSPFLSTVRYGSKAKPFHSDEVGACEDFRVVLVPKDDPGLCGSWFYSGSVKRRSCFRINLSRQYLEANTGRMLNEG